MAYFPGAVMPSFFATSEFTSNIIIVPWKLVVMLLVLHTGHVVPFRILLHCLHALFTILITFYNIFLLAIPRLLFAKEKDRYYFSFFFILLSLSIQSIAPRCGWRMVSEILLLPFPSDTPTILARIRSPSLSLMLVFFPVNVAFFAS